MTPEEIDKIVKDEGEAGFVRWRSEQHTAELIDQYLGIHEDTGWEPIKIADLPPPSPPTICEYAPGKCLMTAGYLHQVYGAGESGKTWLAYLAAVQEVRKGNAVLIVDYEMGGRRTADWLRRLGLTNEEISAQVVFVQPKMTATHRDREGLVDWIVDLDRKLTVAMIDSMSVATTLAGLKDNDTNDMTAWYRSLPRWILSQWDSCAVAVIDHLPKDVADSKFPIGSQRKRSEPDVLISVRNVVPFDRNHDGYSVVAVRKERDGWLHSDADACRLDAGPSGIALGPITAEDAEVVRQMKLRDDIADYLLENPGAKSRDVGNEVRGNTGKVLEELNAMAAEGLVRVEEVGNAHLNYLTGELIEIDASRA